MATAPESRGEFRVAIICALLYRYGRAAGDQNTYLTGRIGPVDAVLVRLSEMGKVIAASTAASLRSSFPNLELAVLTGICGGVPHAEANGIVLGDVILARRVVQYDLGREYHDGFVAKTTVDEGLGRPTKTIRSFLSTIQSQVLITNIEERTVAHLRKLQNKPVPKSCSATYQYPGIEEDELFGPTHLHKHQSGCEGCQHPDKSCDKARNQTCKDLQCHLHGQLVQRARLDIHGKEHGSAPMNPSVFFGCIGSGDKVIKSGQLRDIIAEKHNLVAFEMEGAGVWDEIPCIIVKSVCDYADSHKNKQWQNYAAATAAAATKALLERYPRTDRTRLPKVDLVERGDAQLLTGDNQVNACRDALSLREPVVDLETLKSRKGQRTKGTCKWIKDNEKYQSWLGGDSQFLWISGGPGKGKTMLSIFLTEELEKHTQKSKDTELLFYFCDHQDENRNSAVAVLRSLVCQLLSKRPHLMKSISKYFESSQKTQTTVSSAQALWVVFQTLLQADLGTVLCVIDGLDECDGESTGMLVGKFCDFFSPDKSNKMLKLAIVSRKLKGLEAFCQVNLDHDDEGHVSDDIANFVSAKVEELDKVQDFGCIREQVETTLGHGANGTFLWVSLVIMELLKKTTCTEILDSLEEFPPGLDAMYGRMLQKMKNSLGLVASKILRWVVMATRPLTLSELAKAVQVRPLASLSAEKVMSDYITLCEPMLRVLKVGEEKEIVDLVHQSARDYLLRPMMSGNYEAPEEFLINTGEAHFELLEVCLDCIESSDLRNGPVSDALDLQKSPLLDYALQWWPEHARHSSTYGEKHLDLSRPMFRKQSNLRTYWWVSYWWALETPMPIDFMPSGRLPKLPLLHLASFLGIEWLARKILSGRRFSILSRVLKKEEDDLGNTPLLYAIDRGHEPLVQLLLEKGSKVNVKSSNSQKPLIRAVDCGNGTILKLLLAKKGNVDEKDEEGFTALLRAAFFGYDTEAKLLIEHGADVNAVDEHGNTALIFAANSGHHVIVKPLIEHGANVNAAGEEGLTALICAASYGHEVTAKLLIKKGANVNAANNEGNTALIYAAQNGYEVIIKLLIEKGANVNTANNMGNTALIYAAKNGYEVIIKLLIEKGANINAIKLLIERGANVNTEDEEGWTAIIGAIQNGHEVTTKLLIEKGANINTVSKKGDTALICAAQHGQDTCVELLLKNGACINAKNDYGRTALMHAVINGHDTTVKLLLANGADVNVKDQVSRGSALHLAAECGHENIVELLLKNGACINAKDEDGRTALIYATLNGHDTTVKLLLANGADVNAKDWMEGSALELAAEYGHENIVKLLKASLSQYTSITLPSPLQYLQNTGGAILSAEPGLDFAQDEAFTLR
ncbi:ankyrin repeat protein [Metarhizium robertsii]|uniref:Ankyrin repeat protein n=1 Tax=Metarhizium robertsii TaxID=568076 RepID=A0A0A1URZ0_9HYPO|nr:ankyrin repeat protein [Metarhizium robertsii]